MSLVLNVPEPGQPVDVRQRRYVVVDVAQSVLPPDLLKSGSLSAQVLFYRKVPIGEISQCLILRLLLLRLLSVLS